MSTAKEQTFEGICSAFYQMDGLAEFLGEADAEEGHVAYFNLLDQGEVVMEVQIIRHEPEEQITVRRRWRVTLEGGRPGIATVDGHFLTTEASLAALRTPAQAAVLGVLEGLRSVIGG